MLGWSRWLRKTHSEGIIWPSISERDSTFFFLMNLTATVLKDRRWVASTILPKVPLPKVDPRVYLDLKSLFSNDAPQINLFCNFCLIAEELAPIIVEV